MKKLSFCEVDSVDELAWPINMNELTDQSPALDVLTDFLYHKPLMIENTVSALGAQVLMQKSRVKLQCVIDHNNHFVGLITRDELNEQVMIKKISEGFDIKELDVTDFMVPRNHLQAFDYRDLLNATVADVVSALEGSGVQHCLVVDRENHKIRGVFSVDEIAAKLHIPIDIKDRSSFAHLFNAIYH